jgi:ZIP family zinc transporter
MNAPQNAGLALALTFFAGLSTGIGSAIAYFIKKPKLTYLSFLLGLSAGVMIYISLDELLPAAHHYGQSHLVITGVVTGMLVMAISLLLI